MSKNKLNFTLFLFIIIFFVNNSRSQTVKINVRDNDRKPMPGATVQLTKTSDSKEFFASTNQEGIAVFEKLENTLYAVKISFVGFETLNKSIMVKPDERTFWFRLKESSVGIDVVEVKAKTPLIRQEDDKMIIDPENMAQTSTNTLEVLESTPGLFVDQDGGIYLSSATPAKVYINGREQKMNNQDVSTILRSLPPGSVQRIEVMRTPSTKYDAASSGGIINIVLKKGVKIGRFGSVSAGFNQGKYGNKFAGFTINNSGEKTSQYLNVNYNYNDMEELLNVNRLLQTDTFLRQSAITRNLNHQMYAGYGITYDPNEKLNLSYDGRINYSIPQTKTNNSNLTETIEDVYLSENQNIIENNSDFINIQQDFGALVKLDSSGSEWDSKFSYNFNSRILNQDYEYIFTIPSNYSINGFGDNEQQRHFSVLQSDLTYHFPKKLKIETGVKSSFQNFNSNVKYFYLLGETSLEDPSRTNSFNYNESINAAYFQFSKTIKDGLILKTGVRMEHTYMKGSQTIPSDTSFLINRADFFPYIYLSRRIIKMMGIELHAYMIYRRTINRPEYGMLNPAISFVDQYMYETGNPALKPQFSDNVEINVSFEDHPVFAIGRNYTTDIFSQVVYQNPQFEDVAIRTYDNLGKNIETYLRGMVGIPPGGKYFFALGAQFSKNEYDGLYENQPLSYSRSSWRFFTFHMLSITKNTKFTVFGFIMKDGFMNFYELKDFGMLNIGLRQNFLDNKLTVSFNVRDIFKTMLVAYELNQGGVNAWGDRYTDNRRFGINIRYTFGIGKKEEKKGFFEFEE
ncbi:MAG: TonB-dependent receptor [Bacteroidales bacterium]|nr:TonB-dependent receptor [Bacteroidales bacterium]